MDLIDRYLKAVAKALPEEQKEDIIGELTEDIRSEMEDQQKGLGRSLTEAEQETLLRQRGNPWLLAARYRQDERSVSFGRQIIGPVLFPFYMKVLSFNLGLTFLVIAAIFAALAIGGQRIGFHDIVSTCLLQLFIQLSAVTLIFSLVQKNLTKHPERWHLKGMGSNFALDLKIEQDIKRRMERKAKGWTAQVSRFDSLSIIVASVVALAWLTEVQRHPFLILGPAATFLKLAPIWQQILFPIVLLTVAEIVRATINLVRPDWTLFRAIVRLFVHAVAFAVVYVLFKAGNWVTAGDAMANRAGELTRTVEIVNLCFYYGLVATVILSAGMLVRRIVELIQGWRWRDDAKRIRTAAKEQE